MADINPQNSAFYWATTFLRELHRQGIEHIVISPGSRSTPLTLAAAAHPGFKKHVILDERSAAFTALGIGKITAKPAVLICTSGTAVANYFPAVIEARQAGVPMILATADRPPHLRNTGANQAIDQQHIFGHYSVFFHDAGEPRMQKNDWSRLKKLAQQAIATSCERQGPVHLNFPFRKPLEPDQEFLQKIAQENRSVNEQHFFEQPKDQIKSFRFDDDTLYELHEMEYPLIIIGQLAPATPLKHIFWLADLLEAPVLSEQGITHPSHAIQGFDGFLRNKENLDRLEPDFILRFGLQPASKSLLQTIKHWKPDHHIHFADTERWIDIAGNTTQRIRWNGKYFSAHKPPQKTPDWLEKWKTAESKYFKKVARIFDKSTTLTDGHIYRRLVPQIPKEVNIFISNSLPARDQSLFTRFGEQRILTNRGVSGIDGITSTALGVALGSNQPTVLFTGDLAFLHDSNALLSAKLIQKPLLVIVINNGGGQIFRMLPIEKHDAYFKPYFETEQSVDIRQLVSSHDIPYQNLHSLSQVDNFDLSAWMQRHPGLSVIECQTKGDASMKLRRKLWEIKL